MSALLTRETAPPGTPLARIIGGLPATLAELQAPARRPVIEVTAEAPKKVAGATPQQMQYLNQIGNISPALGAILRPQAAYRWLLPYVASITPQYVETILRGALAGNHVQAWELFDLMIDSNPEIAACVGEYVEGVLGRKIIVDPYVAEGEQVATPTAIRNQKIVSAGLHNLNPDPANDENELEDMVRDILFSRFHGQSVQEEDYYDTYGTGQLNRLQVPGVGAMVAPRCTYWVHPVCYAWDMNGRLGLRVALADQMAQISRAAWRMKPGSRPGALFGEDPMYNTSDSNFTDPSVWNFISSQPMPSTVTDFPRNKFLISIFKQKAGTALAASCLRPLAAWWVYENFSADYAMDLAQIFGIPFRTAYFDPAATTDNDRAFVQEMLQNMGSRGWAMLPNTTKLEFEKAMATGADSPQGFLIKLCHEQYRKVILRQTMTGSGHGGASSGSKAGMSEEKHVKQECFSAGSKHVCKVLRKQFGRHVLLMNLGTDTELPIIRMENEDIGDTEESQTILNLSQAGAGKIIPLSWIAKRFGITAPAGGEETLADTQPPGQNPAGAAPAFDPKTDIVTLRHQYFKKMKAGAEPSDDEKKAALSASGDFITVDGHPAFIGDKGSTSTEKNDNIKDQNEGRTSAGGIDEERGILEKGAGRITTRVVERGAGAGGAGTPSAGPAAAGLQKAGLEKLYAEKTANVEPHSANIIGEGGEHIVEHDPDSDRVIKHTKGAFGFRLDPHDGTYATLEHASPSEYIDRLHAQNNIFGDDSRIEGVSKAYNDHVGFAVSQKFIKSGEAVHPSQAEMESHMKSLGFIQARPQMIGDKEFANKTWWHPASAHVATDVKPDNFIKDAGGNLHVVDVMVQPAPPGGKMEKLMNYSVPRKSLAASAPEQGAALEAATLETHGQDARATAAFAAAQAEDLEPIVDELNRIAQIQDDALFLKKMKDFVAEHGPLVQKLHDINANPKAAKVLQQFTTGQLAAALKQKSES